VVGFGVIAHAAAGRSEQYFQPEDPWTKSQHGTLSTHFHIKEVTYPYAESLNAGSDHSMVIAEMQL
jgi:hypothetical protein